MTNRCMQRVYGQMHQSLRWPSPVWFLLMVMLAGSFGSVPAQVPAFLRVARQPADLVPVSGSSRPGKATPVAPNGLTGQWQPPGGAPWIVYSDRPNNNTFRSSNGLTPFRKMKFMEAFYVLKERNGYLKIVRYDPALPIGNKFSRRVITDRKAAVYYGWAPRSHFLLANQSSRAADPRRAQVVSAVLAQPALLTQPERYFSNDSVRLFADPTQQTPAETRLRLYDLAYVYKLSETRRQALVGRAAWFPPDSVRQMVLGWVPVEVLQEVGPRLFIEADTVNRPGPLVPLYRTASAAVHQQPDSTFAGHSFSVVSWNRLGAKYPVLNQYSTRDSQTVVQTSALLPLLDKKPVPVWNVTGQRIASQVLTQVRARCDRYNLIYVIEGSSAMQPYWGELLNTIQFTITQLSQDTARAITLRVGAVIYDEIDSRTDNIIRGRVDTTLLTTQYDYLMNELRKGWSFTRSRSGIEAKGIRLGVGRALAQFAACPDENNLLILVGMNGDLQSIVNGSLVSSLLKRVECRLLAFQAYGAPGATANDFVLQARELALKIANEGSTLKKARLVRPDMVTSTNEFNLRMGDQNVYQLDYPQRSMVPGWVLFPRKNQALPFRELYAATDSLFHQVAEESRSVVAALETAFQQLQPLGDRLNPKLTPLYASAGTTPPTDVRVFARFADYPFMTRAFTPLKDKGGGRWKYIALLPGDEYDGISRWLDQLSSDDLDPTVSFDRIRLRHRYQQVLRESGQAAQTTRTLDQLLNGLLDLPVANPLFKRITLTDLASRKLVPDALLSQMLYLLRERRDYYRRLPTFRNSRFVSNGRTYYWISEDLFR